MGILVGCPMCRGAGVNKIYRDLILGHSLQGMDVNYIVESGLEDELRQGME